MTSNHSSYMGLIRSLHSVFILIVVVSIYDRWMILVVFFVVRIGIGLVKLAILRLTDSILRIHAIIWWVWTSSLRNWRCDVFPTLLSVIILLRRSQICESIFCFVNILLVFKLGRLRRMDIAKRIYMSGLNFDQIFLFCVF